MSFSFKQAVFGTAAASNASTVTITPTSGDLIVCYLTLSVTGGTGTPTVTVSDGTNNYQVPFAAVGPMTAGTNVWNSLGFIPSCPGGSTTITQTWTTNGTSPHTALGAIEFGATIGGVTFDTPTSAGVLQNSNAASNPITTPSITPSRVGSLLFAGIAQNAGATLTWNSPWTAATAGGAVGYILSSSATTPIANNVTDSTSPDQWVGFIGAFFESLAVPATTININTTFPVIYKPIVQGF